MVPPVQHGATASKAHVSRAFRQPTEIKNTRTWAFRQPTEIKNTRTWDFRQPTEIKNTSTWDFRQPTEIKNTSTWSFRHFDAIYLRSESLLPLPIGRGSVLRGT